MQSEHNHLFLLLFMWDNTLRSAWVPNPTGSTLFSLLTPQNITILYIFHATVLHIQYLIQTSCITLLLITAPTCFPLSSWPTKNLRAPLDGQEPRPKQGAIINKNNVQQIGIKSYIPPCHILCTSLA